MYLEIFLVDFAVFRVFWGNSWDFAEKPEIRWSATARIIRSPDYRGQSFWEGKIKAFYTRHKVAKYLFANAKRDCI